MEWGVVGVVILYGINSFATVLANSEFIPWVMFCCYFPLDVFCFGLLPRIPSTYLYGQIPCESVRYLYPLCSDLRSYISCFPPHLALVSIRTPTDEQDRKPSADNLTNIHQPMNTKTTLETPHPRQRSRRISDDPLERDICGDSGADAWNGGRAALYSIDGGYQMG